MGTAVDEKKRIVHVTALCWWLDWVTLKQIRHLLPLLRTEQLLVLRGARFAQRVTEIIIVIFF